MAKRDFYASTIGALRRDLENKNKLEKKVNSLTQQLANSQTLLVQMLDAQKILSAVSDDNTEQTLNFITGMVNRVLTEIFGVTGDIPRIIMKKKLYAGSRPHIIVEVLDGEGHQMDVVLQNGAGLRQIVSFMYSICLIEIRKGRRAIFCDEYFNGLHSEAKLIMQEIIKIFSKSGFQFIFVEYSMNNLGKIYNVEKRGNESRVLSIDRGEYENNIVYSKVDGVDLSLVDEGVSLEESEDGLVEETTIG